MNLEKLDKLLGFLIIIGLLIFLLLFVRHGTNPCFKCNFDVEGEELNMKEFFQLFSEKCLVEEKGNRGINFAGILNQS